MLAPAERVELWVDFGRWASGSEATLRSLAFEGGVAMGGMGGGHGARAALRRWDEGGEGRSGRRASVARRVFGLRDLTFTRVQPLR